jgi:hypothetical protein
VSHRAETSLSVFSSSCVSSFEEFFRQTENSFRKENEGREKETLVDDVEEEKSGQLSESMEGIIPFLALLFFLDLFTKIIIYLVIEQDEAGGIKKRLEDIAKDASEE